MNISSASFAADESHLVTVDRTPGCTPSSDDGGACRLFKVVNGGKLYLSHIHLRGGKVMSAADSSPGWPDGCSGGLVYVYDSGSLLHAQWSVFGTGNIANPPTEKAASVGGALFAGGAAILLEDSRVVGNWAAFEAGGVALYGASLTTMRSEISGNKISTLNRAGYTNKVSGGGAVAVVYGSVFKAVQTNISYNTALSGQGAGIHMRYGCDGALCTEVMLAECSMEGNDAAGGTGADIRFTDVGNSGEVQKGRLTILNMPSTSLDIGGGGAPVASCSANSGAGKGYCTSLLGRTECKETTASGTEAQLSCEGGTWCTFSKSTEGNHSVPAPGCTLSQMVTVSGTMNVSGVAGASPLHELAAVGGTPTASDPKRHFRVNDGATLTVHYLVLRGGRVWSTYASNNLVNVIGGSILVADGSASLVRIAHSMCSFNEAGAGGCIGSTNGGVFELISSSFFSNRAEHGGAVWGMTGYSMTLEDSTFESNTATNGAGGAITCSTSSCSVQLRGGSNTFIGNRDSGDRVTNTFFSLRWFYLVHNLPARNVPRRIASEHTCGP